MTRALRDDLNKRMRDRLHQWLRDGLALYDMAGINRVDAVEDLLSCQIGFTVTGLMALEATPEVAGELFETLLRNHYELERKEKESKS